jgi:hypothetical protein
MILFVATPKWSICVDRLIGTAATGMPPLVFQHEHADLLLQALDEVLASS